MQRRTLVPFVIFPLIAATLTLGPGPASAQTTSPGPQIARPIGTIVGNGYVIVNPAKAVKGDGNTFYPTGPISSDTLVVIPDSMGNLPAGLTTANLPSVVADIHSQAGGSSVTSASQAFSSVPTSTLSSSYYSWSATRSGYSGSYNGGSIIGTSWSARAEYNFDTASGFSQTAVGLGKGHYRGYNGSTFGVWTTYYGVGTADDGGGDGSVPWGYVADYEGFEAKCANVQLCWGNFWDF